MTLYIISEWPHWAVIGQFLDQPCLICQFGAYVLDGTLNDANIKYLQDHSNNQYSSHNRVLCDHHIQNHSGS